MEGDDTLTAGSGTGGESPVTASSSRLDMRYESVALLGKGGMGAVYLARDKALEGKEVALKVIPTELSDRFQVDSLRREVLLAEKVTHRNVCRIYDLEEVEGQWMIKMEYIAGETLAARIGRGPLSVDDALAIAHQIAAGLGAAHDQGVLHRDLKPSNVMIEKASGRVVLMDFGIARPSSVTGNTAPELVGTPAYMSPEQVLLERTDERSDVYAFGCVLFHMLVGETVFPSDAPLAAAARHVKDSPPDPRRRRPDLPKWLATAILDMLAKDPAARPKDMAAVKRALSRPTHARRRALLVAGAGAGAIAAIGLVLVGDRRTTSPRGGAWTPELAQLPAFDENSNGAALSPDGTMIAYDSDRSRTHWNRIYVARADGRDDRAITPPEMIATHVSWHHDGRSVLFTDLAGSSALYRVSVQGEPPELLAEGATGVACGTSTLLAYFDDPSCGPCTRLVLRSADGTPREIIRIPLGQSLADLRCDRAGTRAAYTTADARRWWPTVPPTDLWVIDLATATPRQLTRDGKRNWTPAFSRDGRTIVFSSARGGRSNLWEISVDGGEPVQLTSGSGNDVAPDVSPDGRTLLFNEDITSRPLFAHPLEGESRRVVPSRPMLHWLSATSDGAEVIATDTAELVPRIVAIRVADGDVRPLADGTIAAPTMRGDEIVYADGGALRIVPRTGGESRDLVRLDGEVTALAVGADDVAHVSLDRSGQREAWRVGLADGRVERDAPSPWCFIRPSPSGEWSIWYQCRARSMRGTPVARGQTPDPDPNRWSAAVADGSFDRRGAVYVYQTRDSVMRLDLATGASVKLLDMPGNGSVVVAPDGLTIYTSETVGRVQRTIITNFSSRPPVR